MLIFNIIEKFSLRLQCINNKIINHSLSSTITVRARRQVILNFKNIHTHNKPPWNILFFGTDDFSVQNLRKLYIKYETGRLLSRLEVVTVFDEKENAVQKFAKQYKLPIHNWPPKIDLTEFHVGLVVSFGHLIPATMIHSFPLGMLNVHGSLLPRWRGAAPIIHALMNGDTETGVSIMRIMPKKFDTGDVLAQLKMDISPDETMPEVRYRMSKIGADLLLDTVEKLPEILELAKPQGEEGITYAPKVNSKLSLVKWDEMTAKNVYDLYRALYGMYRLTTKFMGSTVKLLDIQVLGEPPPGKRSPKKISGLVMYNKEIDKLLIRCRDNSWVAVSTIGLERRPPMSARDFYNGFISKNKNKEAIFTC